MERLTLQFELDWAAHLVAKPTPASADDVRPLFELAQKMQLEIDRGRVEETNAWVAEFNAGMAAFNEFIKSQKDITEKASEANRAAMKAREDQQRSGAIEVALIQTTNPPKSVAIYLDEHKQDTSFVGTSWGLSGVAPGTHVVRLVLDGLAPQMEIRKVLEVAPGSTARTEAKFP